MIKNKIKVLVVAAVALAVGLAGCQKLPPCYVCDPLPLVYYECRGIDTVRILNWGETKTLQQKLDYYRSLGYNCFDSSVTVSGYERDPLGTGRCFSEDNVAYASWNGHHCYKKY